MYDRIVLPLDGRPEDLDSLTAGQALADRWDTSLELVSLVTDGDEVDLRRADIEHRAERLGHSHGSQVQQRTRFVAPELIESQAIDERTLVVMATTAHSRSQSFLGSVAASMLELLRQPVLLIGPNCVLPAEWPSGPLVVCTDGSKFSESIVAPARAWSVALELDPWVVSVGDPEAVTVLGAAESAHVAHVASELAVDGPDVVNFDVLHGRRPAEAIVDYAKGTGASLIAMATHGRTGLRRLALGSVAMSVVHDAHCPVLVVQP